ncbi:cytochrome PufQ [Yoonia sediminilitoris]|uniref:PufQ cytochrome subunit n=1 Tax=Yoonia sediminilitoris TaxID=1286148 RepID=A0A2T6K8J0_9RHOB|nr:cytochrome PufQ [Yoonia sediminilitoris]PUB11061.1 PufQ cytochrome subunit [Yoonia sediminilitoris]RCW90980.1 PufQ cytochrome subunit [Yoonia sediminilitoris]
MTDFTTDAPVMRERHAPPKREYYAYFALIFLATLPLAFLTWMLTAARRMELPEKGPFAKAWTQARIITPHIFSA